VGFVGDKVALGQVFSEYFGFPDCSTLIYHPGLVTSGLGLTQTREPKKNKEIKIK
jgi:hypothetical protein